MNKKQHTPEGVRDIYGRECKEKLHIQELLLENLHAYGYQDIQPPTFEYMDVFREEVGSTSVQELYKFIDREGNILALRPDMTPSIARVAATHFVEEELPVRLCYLGNTFINHVSYQGRLKENTQLGAELIGDASLTADAEMIAMVGSGLLKIGLKEFQISIGHVDFIQSLLQATGLEKEILLEIRQLLINRNFYGIAEVLRKHQVKEQIREAFSLLSELTGGVEILERACNLAPNAQAKAAVERLGKIYEILTRYDIHRYITFDLSMSGNYGYYSGIIFRAYTYGTGDAIVRGGRYDHLLEKFGNKLPSIGFAIYINELLSALRRQEIEVTIPTVTLLVYLSEDLARAIALAKEMRRAGEAVQLLEQKPAMKQEVIEAYGKRIHAKTIRYLS